MSLSVPSKARKSRTHAQDPPRIIVEPSLETQAIYNQIREDEARHHKQHRLQQHVSSEDRLHPPDPRAPAMARSVTNESHISESLSPISTTDLPDDPSLPAVALSPTSGKRPRGRRAGPLKAETRYKTAIKRKLGLVCDRCKVKKVVVCDLSSTTVAF